MNSTRIQVLAGIAVLALAMAGGWLVTNRVQQTVPIVPGVQGCWRLEGSARQIDCLSDEFVQGADEAAGSATGRERDDAVITYVRRAERLAASDERLAGMCHPSMHALGRGEGGRAATEERVPTFPDGSSQLCTAGYVHGLAEGYVEEAASIDVAAIFPKLCHDAAARTGCAHGIGHALVRQQAARSAATMATGALDGCEQLPDEFPTNCHDGVYMELAMRTQPEPVAVDDYAAACDDATTAERELSCWGYLGTSLASNDVPLEQVPAMCATAALPGQFTCIEGYGRDLGTARVARCGSTGDIARVALRERCIDGAVGLQVGSGHVTAGAARTACGALDADALATYCREAVDRYLTGKALVEAGDEPMLLAGT